MSQTVNPDHVLKREFSLWSAFAFAFAFISPDRGPLRHLRSGDLRRRARLLVGLPPRVRRPAPRRVDLRQLVSRWPIEGSIYQWSRRLLGSGYGWFAGWVYMWTLVIAMATVASRRAGFIANIFGVRGAHRDAAGADRVRDPLRGTAAQPGRPAGAEDLHDRQHHRRDHRLAGPGHLAAAVPPDNSLSSALTEGSSARAGYLSLSGPFLVAMAFIGWSFVGFESAGSIAEEVHEPRRNLPKAVIFSIVLHRHRGDVLDPGDHPGDPDLGATSPRATRADPVYDTLTTAWVHGIAKPVEVLFVIGFLRQLPRPADLGVARHLVVCPRRRAARPRCPGPPEQGPEAAGRRDPRDDGDRLGAVPAQQRRAATSTRSWSTSPPAASTSHSCSP